MNLFLAAFVSGLLRRNSLNNIQKETLPKIPLRTSPDSYGDEHSPLVWQRGSPLGRPGHEWTDVLSFLRRRGVPMTRDPNYSS